MALRMLLPAEGIHIVAMDWHTLWTAITLPLPTKSAKHRSRVSLQCGSRDYTPVFIQQRTYKMERDQGVRPTRTETWTSIVFKSHKLPWTRSIDSVVPKRRRLS
jgi:hypothetical protein